MAFNKFFWFDLETTGLNPRVHEIHELSAIVTIPGQQPRTLNLNIRPNAPETIAQEALDLRGLTKDQLMAYPPSTQAFSQLTAWLSLSIDKFDPTDKLCMAGYNIAAFDIPFLNQFFLRHNDKYFGSWFHRAPILDIIHIVSIFRLFGSTDHPLKQCRNQKLSSICAALNIKLDAHAAQNDIIATRQIAHALLDAFLKPKPATSIPERMVSQ